MVPLHGERFTSPTNLHAPCDDIAAIIIGFAAHIDDPRLPTFFIKQYHIIEYIKIGLAPFGHFKMVVSSLSQANMNEGLSNPKSKLF